MHIFSKLLPVASSWFAVIPAIMLMTSCSPRIVEKGKASYYADFFAGRKTASGEKFRQGRRTAAHKTLPFGTRVKVINLKNGKSVKVKINDRGPFVAGRIIDLSKKAARKLDMVDDGVVEVKIKYRKKKK
jgi:rare lipoprotein A